MPLVHLGRDNSKMASKIPEPWDVHISSLLIKLLGATLKGSFYIIETRSLYICLDWSQALIVWPYDCWDEGILYMQLKSQVRSWGRASVGRVLASNA